MEEPPSRLCARKVLLDKAPICADEASWRACWRCPGSVVPAAVELDSRHDRNGLSWWLGIKKERG